MARTKFGKSRPVDKPYAIYKGVGPFGNTEVRVLKTYQSTEKEKGNTYAKWFVAVKTDWAYGSFDMGDSYVSEVVRGLDLVDCEPEWLEEYFVKG